MDLLAEELAFLGGVDLLVVGTEECAFHSNKLALDGAVNESFVLTDGEIVLQDLSALEKVVRRLERRDERTVVLRTCIPSLMNLELASLSDAKNVLFLDVPAFAFLSAEDVLEELYDRLFFDALELGPTTASCPLFSTLLRGDGRTRVSIPSRTWILRQKKYRKLLSHFAMRNQEVRFFDDTHLHRIEDYLAAESLLGIARKDVQNLREMVAKMQGRLLPPVRSAEAADLVLALDSLGLSLSKIVLPRLDERTYRILKGLGDRCEVSFARELPEGVFDLSFLDGCLDSQSSFEVLTKMVEALWHALQ